MTEVAFHFNAPDKLAYACRLLRKAVAASNKVVVLISVHELAALDAQLWTFDTLSFVPHARLGAATELDLFSPVLLTTELPPALPHHQVLVNLGSHVPHGFDRFERVIEVVSLDEQDRHQARQRWKQYSEQGYTLVRHDLQLRESTTG